MRISSGTVTVRTKRMSSDFLSALRYEPRLSGTMVIALEMSALSFLNASTAADLSSNTFAVGTSMRNVSCAAWPMRSRTMRIWRSFKPGSCRSISASPEARTSGSTRPNASTRLRMVDSVWSTMSLRSSNTRLSGRNSVISVALTVRSWKLESTVATMSEVSSFASAASLNLTLRSLNAPGCSLTSQRARMSSRSLSVSVFQSLPLALA